MLRRRKGFEDDLAVELKGFGGVGVNFLVFFLKDCMVKWEKGRDGKIVVLVGDCVVEGI